ncbi:hypothetical protein WH96_19400 [Kiloniella spongiae]|uniref:Glycosyltransferase RgtA/B/C/D-like domain-containing protein n=1 Tax=Kiloniella spongiae TaxID=1489064 RepID=A0A0H2MR29_9PROT|nr:hypothetical protein [Kiloniella spongiae]KLN59135.1 hypothetical protein WH96_19400 [Kiloniella spongiae]
MTSRTFSQHRKSFLKKTLLIWFSLSVLIIGSSIWLSNGHLIYTLDDPYIHLSVAENIIQGSYGVNTGEYASPSSSIIYPLLLSLGELVGLAQFTPLLLNIIATGLSVYILLDFFWCYVLPQDTHPNNLFVNLIGLLLIISISGFALPMTGMEHSLHVLVALATIRGLIILVEENLYPIWFLLAVITGPLIRFEGLALSTATVIALLFLGHQRLAIIIILSIAGIIALYGFTMLSIDLSILPSSVMVKSNVFVIGTEQSGIGNSLLALVTNFRSSLTERWGLIFLVTIIVVAMIIVSDLMKRSFSHRKLWCAPKFIIGGVLILTLLAHLVAGRYNWFHRYEVYAVSVMTLGMLYLLSKKIRATLGKNDFKGKFLFIGFLIALGTPYSLAAIATPSASRGIYEQQYQMHRFATDYFARPVAVNDLGWVSYKNNQYVLDLWGLGSEKARKLRANNTLDANTVNILAEEKNIDYAMIYKSWFGANIPRDWCLIAELKSVPVTAASGTVHFYAITDFAKENMHHALENFAKILPNRVVLKRYTCP